MLDALAAHYGIAGTDPRWRVATHGFRTHMIEALQHIRMTAPPGFTGRYVRDCLPERMHATLAPSEADKIRRAECLRQRDLVTQALRDDLRGLATLRLNQREAALGSLPALLEDLRAKIEAGLLDQTTPMLAAVDVDKLAELAASLDDYDSAVEGAVYPHMHDPAAIPVEVPITRAVPIRTAVSRREVRDLQEESVDAIAAYHRAIQERPSADRDAKRYTPTGAFAAAVEVVLSPARQAEVGHHGIHATLAALNRVELDGMARKLGIDTVALNENQARLRVLTELGLSTDQDPLGPPTAEETRRLREKIGRDEFDAFIAYNAEDKAAVQDVCHILRRHGVYPWIDLEQIQPGTWVQDGIQSAIRRVRVAVVFVGPQGLGPWQKLEVSSFIDQCVADQVRVLPVLLPGVHALPEGLLFLRQFSFVLFRESVFETDPLQRLITSML